MLTQPCAWPLRTKYCRLQNRKCCHWTPVQVSSVEQLRAVVRANAGEGEKKLYGKSVLSLTKVLHFWIRFFWTCRPIPH